MKSITKEQEKFLNECTWGTWKLNTESGLVDVDANFNCSDMGLSDFLGIEFGIIKGRFNCSYNRLVSLEGAPVEVKGDFDCSHNRLVSLKGSPLKVGAIFKCSDNRLASLEDGPLKVELFFECTRNPLASLKWAPLYLGTHFYCDPISLRECPIGLPDKIRFDTSKGGSIGLKSCIEKKIGSLDAAIYLKKIIG